MDRDTAIFNERIQKYESYLDRYSFEKKQKTEPIKRRPPNETRDPKKVKEEELEKKKTEMMEMKSQNTRKPTFRD